MSSALITFSLLRIAAQTNLRKSGEQMESVGVAGDLCFWECAAVAGFRSLLIVGRAV